MQFFATTVYYRFFRHIVSLIFSFPIILSLWRWCHGNPWRGWRSSHILVLLFWSFGLFNNRVGLWVLMYSYLHISFLYAMGIRTHGFGKENTSFLTSVLTSVLNVGSVLGALYLCSLLIYLASRLTKVEFIILSLCTWDNWSLLDFLRTKSLRGTPLEDPYPQCFH